MEKRVDRKHDKGCQKERARNIDARVLDFFAHGDARFKTREAPPDHADACRKTHLSVFGQKRRCLYERGEIDVGDHGEKPNHRYAPEKEHKTVLKSPGNLDAADVGDDETGGDDNGNGDIGKRQRDAKRRKQRLEVVAESESFSTRDGHQRDDEVPAGKNACCAPDADGCKLVCAAGVGERSAHFGIKKRRINTDQKCDDGSKDDRWPHQAHNVGADSKKSHADDGTGRDGDCFAHTEAAFERG